MCIDKMSNRAEVAKYKKALKTDTNVTSITFSGPGGVVHTGHKYLRCKVITINGIDYRDLPTYSGIYIAKTGLAITGNRTAKQLDSSESVSGYRVFDKTRGKWRHVPVWILVGLAWNGLVKLSNATTEKELLEPPTSKAAANIAVNKQSRKREYVVYDFYKNTVHKFYNFDVLRAAVKVKLPVRRAPVLPRVVVSPHFGVCLITKCMGDMSYDTLRQMVIELYYMYIVKDIRTGELSYYTTMADMRDGLGLYRTNLSLDKAKVVLRNAGLELSPTVIKFCDKRYTATNTTTNEIVSDLTHLELVEFLGVTVESVNSRFRPSHTCYRKPLNNWELAMLD